MIVSDLPRGLVFEPVHTQNPHFIRIEWGLCVYGGNTAMKLDKDLVREILLDVESYPSPDDFIKLSFEGWSD